MIRVIIDGLIGTIRFDKIQGTLLLFFLKLLFRRNIKLFD